MQEFSTPPGINTTSASRRTIGEIFQEADQLKQQRQELKRQNRAKKKRQKLAALEIEEETLWQNVYDHISKKNSNAYDSAIAILKDLLLLAKHRGTQEKYEQRIRSLLKKNPRLSSLKSKISRAKLLRNSV